MKNPCKRISIILVAIIVLIGGSFMMFTLTSNYETVKASKQLIIALENNDLQTVSRIIEQYPKSVNTLPTFSPWWWHLITEQPDVYYPIQVACAWGNYDVTKLLIDSGADVNHTWKGIESSKTALMWAVISGSERTTDILKLLLEHDADKSVKDARGKTAFDYAIEKGNMGFAELLKLE